MFGFNDTEEDDPRYQAYLREQAGQRPNVSGRYQGVLPQQSMSQREISERGPGFASIARPEARAETPPSIPGMQRPENWAQPSAMPEQAMMHAAPQAAAQRPPVPGRGAAPMGMMGGGMGGMGGGMGGGGMMPRQEMPFVRENPYGQTQAAAVRQNAPTAGASGGSMGPLAYLAPIAMQAMDRRRQQEEARRQQKHAIYAGLAQSQGAEPYGMQAARYRDQNRDIEGTDYLSELLPLLSRRQGRG